jgi:acylphosphatase
MKYRFSIIAKGRVQGVYFRKSCEKKADLLRLTGFVRNENDGSVYIEIQGDLHACTQLMLWAEKGPELAWVEYLHITRQDTKEESEFVIRTR